jgi:putative holliday junction resolvase
VRVVALDYGAARTGVAVSDASGTLARPVCVVRKASTETGLAEVVRLVTELEAEQVVIGLPLTLRGEHGKQAAETELFVSALRELVAVPVETADERFTTALAQRFGGKAPEDAAAAAHLLQSWLDRNDRDDNKART